MIPKKGSEYLSEKMISHKISTDKGLLGKWKPDEEEDSFGTLVFTDQERCDFDSSNKCYKIIKNSDTMKEVLYYDNDFIYIYMPDNFNPSDGVPASVERWYDKLFGIMTYELNGDELTFSFAMLFNRLSK
jgi:hypothetical protein